MKKHFGALVWTLLLSIFVFSTFGCVTKKAQSPVPPKTTTKAESLGDSYFKKGNYEQAIKAYDTAISEGADKASIYYRKGFVYFTQNNWVKARKEFKKAVIEDRTLTIAYEGAAIASFQLAQLDTASLLFEKTISMAPNHWVPYAFMAAIMSAKGHPSESRVLHQKAIQLAGPEYNALATKTLSGAFQRAAVFLHNGDYVRGKPQKKVAEEDDESEAKVTEPAETTEPVEATEPAETTETQTAAQEEQPLEQKQEAAQEVAEEPAEESEEEPAVLTKENDLKIAIGAELIFNPLTPSTTEETTENTTQESESDTTLADSSSMPEASESDAVQAPAEEPAETSEETTAASVAPSPDGSYVVMESSFATDNEANRQVANLKKRGVDAFVHQADLGDKGTWHRVYIGPFATHSDAKARKADLMQNYGVKDALVLKIKK